MPFGTNKQHKRGKSNQSVVMQLGNGQLLITVPKVLAGFKGIKKGAVLNWSDGGEQVWDSNRSGNKACGIPYF